MTPPIPAPYVKLPFTMSATLQPQVVAAPTPQSAFQSFVANDIPDAGSHTSFSYVGAVDSLICTGSGANGPDSADYGRAVSVQKRNYGVVGGTTAGEIDCLLIIGRQDGPGPTTANPNLSSDMDGIQMNLQQSGYPGYMAGAELQITRIDPAQGYQIVKEMGCSMGVFSPYGKNGEQGLPTYGEVNELTFGYLAGAALGQHDRAFFVEQAAGSSWAEYFRANYGGQHVMSFPSVVGSYSQTGAIRIGARPFGGTATSVTLVNDGAGNLLFLDATETKTLLKVDQSGNVTTMGYLSINGDVHGGRYFAYGAKVVDAQQSAIANATGSSDVVSVVNAVLAALRAHGLIAT